MVLYYITDRSQFSGEEPQRREALLSTIAAAAQSGVDFIQLRERDFSSRELEALAREAAIIVRKASGHTRLLINSRSDVALAVGADGVHLRSDDLSAIDVRNISKSTGATRPVIGVSCHSSADVDRAAESGADFVVFGPIFEKSKVRAKGIETLRTVVREKIPVLAIGGVTLENAALCLQAGAAGVAGIRLFQLGDMAETVAELRSLSK